MARCRAIFDTISDYLGSGDGLMPWVQGALSDILRQSIRYSLENSYWLDSEVTFCDRVLDVWMTFCDKVCVKV